MSSAGNANRFEPTSRFVSAKDVKTSFPPQERNLHAFSYKDTDPMINTRVINETAAIVKYLNETVITH